MVNIGFSLQPKYEAPVPLVISLIKEVGFSAVSPVWTEEIDLGLLSSCVHKQGLAMQSLHAPHKGIPFLWDKNSALFEETKNNILRSIKDCAKYKIPILVIHGWQGFDYNFCESRLDFSAFDSIVDCAGQNNLSIAFENLEGEEYLQALMARYSNLDYVGFCWDSGHDHCYPHSTDFLASYGNRLIMTHLHDNMGLRSPDGVPTGDDDLHFIPYDGDIDWETAIYKLKKFPKQKTLNFEIKKQRHANYPEDLIYKGLTLKEFFIIAGQRARKIADFYEQVISDEI